MSSTTLCSTSASSLSSSDRSSSTTTSTDRIRPTSHRKPTATRAMATNTTKIPPGKGVRTAATVKSKSQALGSSKEREAVAKRSLTRAGGRAVAASLKTAGNPVNRSPTPTRKASSTATGGGSRREKPPTHLKLATTSTTSSSSSNPSTPQGRVRGIRTASAAKVQPLKIPAALKRCVTTVWVCACCVCVVCVGAFVRVCVCVHYYSLLVLIDTLHCSNISFTELKKQNQILLKDIDQLKSDRKDDASKHDEEMSALKSQLHKTEVRLYFSNGCISNLSLPCSFSPPSLSLSLTTLPLSLSPPSLSPSHHPPIY